MLEVGGALGIPGWSEIGKSSEALSAYYHGIARNLRLCAKTAARCFVTAWFTKIWPFTILTRATAEACGPWRYGYYICEPSLRVRRSNEKGKD